MLSVSGVLRKKKEFFEKIYIDRKVVQEASAEIYFGTRVKRNKPSSDANPISKKQVLDYNNLGDSFWTDYNILEIEYTIFYNGEFDPGSGWTLATGLTHASRGVTRGKLAFLVDDRRTGE